tara:strand:- start:10746 stop:11579 length:834 start_codon:yes stop_codon:yes gene_type:complete
MTMGMTKKEKQILTLLDDSRVNNYIEFIKKITDYPEPIIKDLAERFLKEGLIKKIKIPNGDEEVEWFFFTEKVTEDMIDDDVRYKRDMGIYLQKEIIYSIEDETEKGRAIIIKAGKKWVGKNKVIQYEGIKLNVPKEVRSKKSIIFAIMSIQKGNEHDTFDLLLHAHDGPTVDELEKPYNVTSKSECYIDAGGDIETTLTISKDLLKNWTKLDGKEIDNAFNSIKMGSTYNLMIALPRTITLTKYKIIIFRNLPRFIDSMNVCNLLFENKHPIDKKK